MFENVLEVAESPDELIVYASLGKAARSWPDAHAIVNALLEAVNAAADPLIDLRVERPSLEDRFLELTDARSGNGR